MGIPLIDYTNFQDFIGIKRALLFPVKIWGQHPKYLEGLINFSDESSILSKTFLWIFDWAKIQNCMFNVCFFLYFSSILLETLRWIETWPRDWNLKGWFIAISWYGSSLEPLKYPEKSHWLKMTTLDVFFDFPIQATGTLFLRWNVWFFVDCYQLCVWTYPPNELPSGTYGFNKALLRGKPMVNTWRIIPVSK